MFFEPRGSKRARGAPRALAQARGRGRRPCLRATGERARPRHAPAGLDRNRVRADNVVAAVRQARALHLLVRELVALLRGDGAGGHRLRGDQRGADGGGGDGGARRLLLRRRLHRGLARRALEAGRHERRRGAKEEAEGDDDGLRAKRPRKSARGAGRDFESALHLPRASGRDGARARACCTRRRSSAEQTESREAADLQTHEKARLWWDRATLLLPPQTLLQRYPELAPLTEMP